ncbi:hypothetical protein [Nocardioides sp.]|uniref:hypothetical protein n=1 Tax=Nocardioides sp. TaxID=35761 RepID=UPI002B6375AE|nr:hypothetical protein [Nocardioides sp.]HXH78148.1 hypothetical protein [Nocardioides sp.]
MTPGDELERSEIEAVLETRRELGLRYDTELVDGFADRIQAEVERRVGAEVQIRDRRQAAQKSAGARQLALGIVSVLAGIPMTAICLAVPENGELSLFSLIFAWGGMSAVNIAHALQARQSRS